MCVFGSGMIGSFYEAGLYIYVFTVWKLQQRWLPYGLVLKWK